MLIIRFEDDLEVNAWLDGLKMKGKGGDCVGECEEVVEIERVRKREREEAGMSVGE